MPPFSFSGPVLALDASTTAGSVAVWRDGELAGADTVTMGAGQADALFPAIVALLDQAGLDPRRLCAIVCGAGPGSFTSLRIAAALAKGLAHGAGCPLFAVPSLLVAAAAHVSEVAPSAAPRFVVHADALRGERYVLPVERAADGFVRPAGPLARLALATLQGTVPADHRVAVLATPFSDDTAIAVPDVRHVTRAAGAWREQAVSLEAWEPEYGRLAEAQVKWEERYGMALPDTPAVPA